MKLKIYYLLTCSLYQWSTQYKILYFLFNKHQSIVTIYIIVGEMHDNNISHGLYVLSTTWKLIYMLFNYII